MAQSPSFLADSVASLRFLSSIPRLLGEFLTTSWLRKSTLKADLQADLLSTLGTLESHSYRISPATGLQGNLWVCVGVEGLLSLGLWQHQRTSMSSSSETWRFSVFSWGWRAPTGFAIRAHEPEFTQKEGQKGRLVYLSGHIAYPLETPEITAGILGRRMDTSSLTQRSLSLQVYRWRHYFTGPRHCPTAIPVISWWRDGLRHWYRWASLFPN